MELLVIAILLTLTGAQGSQLEGPQNTLSVVGSNVTLKCLSPSRNCNGIDWIKYSHGYPSTVFRDRGGISIAFRGRYSVENNSPGCGLIIENVQLTDAGRFLCRAIVSSSSVEKAAYLIILETRPKCAINVSLDNTVEGDIVRLTCEVTYNGTLNVSMRWIDVADYPATMENGGTISQSYCAVAFQPEVPIFTCITSFAVEIRDKDGYNIYGLASNIPVTTCETPAIKVLYSVRNVTLSPSLPYYSPGSVITCKAKGHPLPSVKWQEFDNDCAWVDMQEQTRDVFTVSVVTSKRFRCVAMNVVRGMSYKATSHHIHFNNIEFVTDKLSSEDRFGIGIAIGFGTGLLVAILLAIFALAILVRFRSVELHPRPANTPLYGGAQNMDHEMRSSSSRQLPALHPSIPRTSAPLVGEPESTYASLGEDRDANEYAALELRQKTKPKK